MDIQYLTQLLNNKIGVLTNGKVLAFNSGDMDTINKMDAEIIATQDTINKLVMLQTITDAANAANTTPAELISNGLEASQSRPIVLDNATACLGLYNITSYATDPLHEKKIADILENMEAMDTSGIIDAYIEKEAIGSPLNGHMILTAASQYNVDVRLLMALMEQDSNFGTAGLAINTKNPGNVGNTDSGATHTFETWDAGVAAVAIWLDAHRIITPPVPAVVEDAAVVAPVTTPDSVVTDPAPVVQEQKKIIDTSTAATTTPEIINTETATSTPSIDVATTTPVIDTSTTTPIVNATSTASQATSTDSVIDTATSTLNINLPGTTTPAFTTPIDTTPVTEIINSTSTPDITSTSTQARRLTVKRSRV